jgi:hypothetical protein
MRRSDYERQPAPEFLFERRPLRRWPPAALQPGEAVLVVDNQPAHRVTRHEERVIPRGDAPILTVHIRSEQLDRRCGRQQTGLEGVFLGRRRRPSRGPSQSAAAELSIQRHGKHRLT